MPQSTTTNLPPAPAGGTPLPNPKGATMPQIRNTMRVTQRGANMKDVPKRPRDDWEQSARHLWQHLLAVARKDDVATNLDGAPGFIWEGNFSTAVDFLWPEISKVEKKQAQTYLSVKLKTVGSVRCVQEGRGTHTTSWWFVPEQWGALPAPEPKRISNGNGLVRDEAAAQWLAEHNRKGNSDSVWFAYGYLGLDTSQGRARQWLILHGIDKPPSTVRTIQKRAQENLDPHPAAFEEGQRAAKEASSADAGDPVVPPEPVVPVAAPTAPVEPVLELPDTLPGRTDGARFAEVAAQGSGLVQTTLDDPMDTFAAESRESREPAPARGKNSPGWVESMAASRRVGARITAEHQPPVHAAPPSLDSPEGIDATRQYLQDVRAERDGDLHRRVQQLEADNEQLRSTVDTLKHLLASAIDLI